jgi:hypothetical protein
VTRSRKAHVWSLFINRVYPLAGVGNPVLVNLCPQRWRCVAGSCPSAEYVDPDSVSLQLCTSPDAVFVQSYDL